MLIIISISYIIAISNAMRHVWVISYSLPRTWFSLLCKIENAGYNFSIYCYHELRHTPRQNSFVNKLLIKYNIILKFD